MDNIDVTMNRASKVYFGPSTSAYAQVGSVSSGEAVRAHWTEERGTWVYITYYVDGKPPKAGYVKMADINTGGKTINSKTLTSAVRYVHNQSGADVYYLCNPYESEDPMGKVSYGEKVTYLGVKEGPYDYAYIEYAISGSSLKKGGWVNSDSLGVSKP